MWSVESVFVCALALLGRSAQSLPPVLFSQQAPAARFVAGYITDDAHIVLVTSTEAFTEARHARKPCADADAIREIAGVLAHEEWHVRHGADEEGAYDAQLTTLLYVGAEPEGALYHKVKQAKLAVMAASKRAARDGVVASRAPADLGTVSMSARLSR